MPPKKYIKANCSTVKFKTNAVVEVKFVPFQRSADFQAKFKP